MKGGKPGRVRMTWAWVAECALDPDSPDPQAATRRVTRFLREKGFDDTEYAGCNPVMLFSIKGHAEALQQVVRRAKNRANNPTLLNQLIEEVGSLDGDGPNGTALLHAACHTDGRCAAILVEEGADTSAKWKDGPLQGANPIQTAFAGGLLDPAKVRRQTKDKNKGQEP